MSWILVIFLLSLLAYMYVVVELYHYYNGHDVYEWTKKLDEWLKKSKKR